MRRVALAVLIALSGAVALVQAQTAYVAFEQLTVANTSVGFTASKISPAGRDAAQRATCRLETAEIRWTSDGLTTPTTTVGTLLEIGDSLVLTGQDTLGRFRAIRTGGTSGLLSCHYTNP